MPQPENGPLRLSPRERLFLVVVALLVFFWAVGGLLRSLAQFW
jgi:hypothetical protein